MNVTSPHHRNSNRGLTLVEVLIAAAIILVFLIALLGVHSLYLKTAFSNKNVIQAAYLAEEGIEVTRFLRDASWSLNISTVPLDTQYGLVFENGSWQLSTSQKFVDQFERTITFSAVYRDVSGDIVSSGGALDPDTRLVVSRVSWPRGGATTTKSVATYITDLLNN